MPRPSPMTKPLPLQAGDVVRVVAPASPFQAEDLNAGVQVLESWGYRVRMRDDIADRELYLAGAPERRAAELHEAWADEEARAVLPVRGGYGLTTVLPLLDPNLFRDHPKVIVGCSDLTALLQWVVSSAETTCFHGPMVGSLGRGSDEAGTTQLRALLAGELGRQELTSQLPDAYQWCVAPGTARGRAVGGSLSLLAATCGTPYQLDTTGAVLFLEDVGERPYRVDRMLTQLEQCGLFDGAEAVVFGDFVNCDEPDGAIGFRDAIDRVFRRIPVPVLMGLPFGHGSPNMAFPLGIKVDVDAGEGTVRFRESGLGT